MFSKALLLGGSGKVNTTGKFALTNGYKFKATDPDFPGWGEYNYGYISNDIGDVTPVPKLRGHTLCSFYYNDNMDMGGRGLVEFGHSSVSDPEWPDEFPEDLYSLRLINHTTGTEYSAFYISHDGAYAKYVSDVPVDVFSPSGSDVVWEIAV